MEYLSHLELTKVLDDYFANIVGVKYATTEEISPFTHCYHVFIEKSANQRAHFVLPAVLCVKDGLVRTLDLVMGRYQFVKDA